MQRDLSAVQSDVKLLVVGLAEMRAQLANVIANQAHLATREWVGERLFRAGAVVVSVLVALVGLLASLVVFAPQIWAWLGAPGFAR